MKKRPRACGSTVTEVASVIAALVLLLAISVPVIAGMRSDAGLQQSMSNLVTMGLAHVVYAADWAGRQVTWNPDDLGVYGGDPVAYNDAHGCQGGSDPTDPNCHPPVIAGLGQSGGGDWRIWGYWSTSSNRAMLQPIGFPDAIGAEYWGHHRIPNSRPFHEYLTGRYHDAIYYAPKDTTVLANVEDCIGGLAEFVTQPPECNPAWSSYCFSAAVRYHPDVWRSNAAGGWQAPWELGHGYQMAGFFQATYPGLKTHMIEHSWLQGPPAECNPAFTGCEPYYFNHGIDSTPAALFFDGSVRLLPNEEVLFADFQVLSQTDGVDGLWHRGTPFGYNGYLIGDGWDYVPLSHHVLTTDGILGRDTLSGIPAGSSSMTWKRPADKGDAQPTLRHATAPNARDPMPLTAEGDQP